MTSTYLCVGYEAYVREIDEPLTTKFEQYLTLYVKSAANTEVTYDFGNYVAGSLGTFWTAATADTTAVPANPQQGVLTATTAGAVATAAVAALQTIGVQANACMTVESPLLLALQPSYSGAVLTASQYAITIANNAPNIALDSGSAPTTTTAIRIKWDLAPGQHGVKSPVAYY